MDRFGQEVRRLRWYSDVKRRDDDGGQNGAGDAAAREEKTEKTKQEVFGCGEGEHAEGRSERR